MKSLKLSRSKNKQYKKSTKHKTKKTPKHSKKKTKSEIKRRKRVKKKSKEKKKVVTLMNGGGCGCSAPGKQNSMKTYMQRLNTKLNIQGGGGYTVMPANHQHFSNIVEYNDNNPPEINSLN